MKKIVFICSLGHSGSTLLDLILGCNSRIRGLGEIDVLLNKDVAFESTPCMCGNNLNECIFWSDMYGFIKNNKTLPFDKKYNKVITHFDTIFDSDNILVDSSKYLHVLKKLIALKYKLQVIYLIKDVRGFTYSQKRIYKKNPKNVNAIVRMRFLRNKYFYYLWYKRNMKIKKFLIQNNIDYFQLGYEELCFNTIKIIKKICNFIEVEFEDNMLFPYKSKSHGTGNKMRRMPEKKSRIIYDYAWMFDSSLSYTSTISPHIMKFNTHNVYNNKFNLG